MAQLADQIAVLDDQDALRVLASAIDARGEQVDPFAWREVEPRLRHALAQPDLAQHARPDLHATQASIARTALLALAEHDPTAVQRALALSERAGGRVDPCWGWASGRWCYWCSSPTSPWSATPSKVGRSASILGRCLGPPLGGCRASSWGSTSTSPNANSLPQVSASPH